MLTVVAVALATALLVALVTIVDTGNSRVVRQLSKGGPATGIRVAGGGRDLDDATVSRLRRLPHVSSVTPVLVTPVLVVPPPTAGRRPQAETVGGVPAPELAVLSPFAETAVGVDVLARRDLPISLLAGRLPGPDARAEVAVTEDFLDRLRLDAKRPDDILGREVEIGVQGSPDPRNPTSFRGRWTRSVIVGVVAQEAGSGDVLLPLEQARRHREWALRVGGETLRRSPGGTSEYSVIFVVAQGLNRVHEVRRSISDLGYSATAPEQMVVTVQRYLRVVEMILAAIGMIGLTIASVGIANALFAAVRERRREIGVLKAIGARDRDVRRCFLIEALLVGAAGGAIGTAFGLGVAHLVGAVVNSYLRRYALEGVSIGLPFRIVLLGMVSAAVLSLLGGTLPAVRAARLPAREAVEGT